MESGVREVETGGEGGGRLNIKWIVNMDLIEDES